jgi:CBS domain-containing protein
LPSTTSRVKGTLDLKTRGARLFVDCARVFALALGIRTPAQLLACASPGERLHVERRHVNATVEAFHFLQLCACGSRTLRPSAATPTGSIPTRCTMIDQRMLKEAFRQAKLLQERLRLSYRL